MSAVIQVKIKPFYFIFETEVTDTLLITQYKRTSKFESGESEQRGRHPASQSKLCSIVEVPKKMTLQQVHTPNCQSPKSVILGGMLIAIMRNEAGDMTPAPSSVSLTRHLSCCSNPDTVLNRNCYSKSRCTTQQIC